jgi:hypothetical protein
VRPKFSIQGFLAVLAVLAGWILVLLSRSDNPQLIGLLRWEPVPFFPTSPVLLIDNISWYFALAIMSLSLSLIITSISQLGQSLRSAQIPNRSEMMEVQGSSGEAQSSSEPVKFEDINTTSHWQSWAGMSVLTSLGLVAVTAGNLLTLLLAWAALDVFELIILLGQVMASKSRERIILAFTARMAGIGTVILAGIIPWSQGISLSFDAISQSTSIYLLLAAGLRLGVLPLHLPYIQVLPLRRGFGTILRLVPAASSYILLVRVADVGVIGPASPYLVGFTVLAGLFAAFNWLNAQDEINGRPYWLLGTASLAVASAILNRPIACIAWSTASILSGGMVFSMSMRHKNLSPLAFLAIISLSALPFTPTWMGVSLYEYSNSFTNWIPRLLFFLLSFGLLITHSVLLAGFMRHVLRGIISSDVRTAEHIERWVWLLYPLGLVVIVVANFLIGWRLYPNLNDVTLSGWVTGILTVIISGILWYAAMRYPRVLSYRNLAVKGSAINRFFSLDWMYSIFWKVFSLLTRLSSLISTILEGDGGILWAMVLFALIFVFLQR